MAFKNQRKIWEKGVTEVAACPSSSRWPNSGNRHEGSQDLDRAANVRAVQPAAEMPVPGTGFTSAMNRSPFRCTVCTNRGCSGGSLRTWRILRIAVLMPCSISTKTPLPQSLSSISSLLTSRPSAVTSNINNSIGSFRASEHAPRGATHSGNNPTQIVRI